VAVFYEIDPFPSAAYSDRPEKYFAASYAPDIYSDFSAEV